MKLAAAEPVVASADCTGQVNVYMDGFYLESPCYNGEFLGGGGGPETVPTTAPPNPGGYADIPGQAAQTGLRGIINYFFPGSGYGEQYIRNCRTELDADGNEVYENGSLSVVCDPIVIRP